MHTMQGFTITVTGTVGTEWSNSARNVNAIHEAVCAAIIEATAGEFAPSTEGSIFLALFDTEE